MSWEVSLCSDLQMCGRGVRNILLLDLVHIDNICVYMAHVCFYVCCSDLCGGMYECLLCIGRC